MPLAPRAPPHLPSSTPVAQPTPTWRFVSRFLLECGLLAGNGTPAPFTGPLRGCTAAQAAWVLAEALACALQPADQPPA